MTPILGVAQCSAEDAYRWATDHGAPTFWADLARTYWEQAPHLGVRADVAYAQGCKETGFGWFGGVIGPLFHNPCGLKTTAGGGNYDPDAHTRFPDWATGIRAHLEHLHLYAKGPVPDPVDPRHFPSIAGTAPTVEALSGRWAPSSTYHESILRYVEEMSAMTAYLVVHPPRRSQFRKVRRAKPTGTIVLHSAENTPDLHLPDDGAERIAEFIRGRGDAGSYHTICDQDSRVRLVPFAWEAFGDGTGSNPWAIHLSVALRAEDWPRLTNEQRFWYVASLATAARDASDWLDAAHGIEVPVRRLTKASATEPGFCSHQDRETWFGRPGRRSDPWGNDEGMWHLFLTLYADTASQPPTTEDSDDMHAGLIIAAYAERYGELSKSVGKDITTWIHAVYAKPPAERDGAVAYIRAQLGLS